MIAVDCVFFDGTLAFADKKRGGGSTFASDAFLRDVSKEIQLPIFGIGGIASDNIDRLIHLGVTRVAIASSITGAADPGEESRLIRSLLPTTKEIQPHDVA